MNSPLTVYKASAGSGKTFRLAIEYIKSLILNPKAYEGILAVTFTNKATEEMKLRILSQLYGLAHGLKSSKDYMECITKELGMRPEDVSIHAREALHSLLHSYSYFRVETIDRFFQRILRNLARELDLTPNLRIELGDKEIEYKAVDEMIDSLKDKDRVMTWIIDYISSNMDEQKSWNIISSIKSFGEQILKDEYKSLASTLPDGGVGDAAESINFTEFNKQLRSIMHSCQDEMNAHGREMLEMIHSHGYDVSSFSGGTRGVYPYIEKIATLSLKAMEPSDVNRVRAQQTDEALGKWLTKKADAQLRDFVIEQLRPKFASTLERYDVLKQDYRSASITAAHLSEFRLLQAIRQQVEQSNKEQGRFLLSDTQALLHDMIADSDSPFIYEKIGAHLNQIMIDEFQDTSRIQWQNFKVLLNDCMSNGTGNLIVGDVKQSIYRWRSGDWRLLNDIKGEFDRKIEVVPLRHNFRSTVNVVNFNNIFFKKASELVHEAESKHVCQEEGEALKNAYKYDDLKQITPDGKAVEGLVETHFIKGKSDEYKTNTLDIITDIVRRLKDEGVADSKIAIIVRANRQIALIAEHLLANIPGLKIVSDEAFKLSSSAAVNIIIDAMRLLMMPDDRIVQAQLVYNYQKYVAKSDEDFHHILLHDDLTTYLPEAFVSNMPELYSTPLYQLAERLYQIFDLSQLKEQSAFVCTLFDNITEFISRQTGLLSDFIRHWDDSLSDKMIESDSNDGLRILTIHKSKGLEYDNVICPFLDWKMNKQNILWTSTDVAPYNTLPFIPLDYNANLKDSVYDKDYWHEHLQNAVDDINLLYVAFTRASKNLFLLTQDGAKSEDSRATLIVETFKQLQEMKPDTEDYIAIEQTEDDEVHTVLSFGKLCTGSKNKSDDDDDKHLNVFSQEPDREQIGRIETFTRNHEFRQSGESREFTMDDDDEQQRQQYIKLGNIMHHVFQNIRTQRDIPQAILQLQMDGMLTGQDISAEALENAIDRCMKDKDIARWFSDGWTIHNECTIIESEGGKAKEHRPDRVITNDDETIVIDFKLANDKPGYHDQVHRYMELLTRMGYSNVKGYLLFMLKGKAIRV